MSVIEDLKAVKQAILDRGWNKGRLVDPETKKCCLLGAVGLSSLEGFEELALLGETTPAYHAIADSEPSRTVVRELMQSIPRDLFKNSSFDRDSCDWINPLWRFNDSHVVGEAGVMNLIDRTIERLEERL